MRSTSVKEFKQSATRMLRGRQPVLITRRGSPAALCLPLTPELVKLLPKKLRREIAITLSARIRKHLEAAGLQEDDIIAEFEAFRKARRRR